MGDDRAAEDLAETVARLERTLEDVRSLALVRGSRSTTGTIDITLLVSPPVGTLLLDGQTPLRADFPALWQWIQDMNPAGFTTGNGTTTFGIPDMRGRVLIGANPTYPLGTAVGSAASSVSLSTANMPSHSHSHTHGTAASGTHAGHHSGTVWGYSVNVGGGVGAAYVNASDGGHTHGNVGTDATTAGSGTSFNVPTIQPGIAVNMLVWT